MEIPRHWRLKKERYNLTGIVCPNPECKTEIFPPRPICPECHGHTNINQDKGIVYAADGESTSFPKEASMSSI